MTTQFPITNVINVTLVPSAKGLGEFNTSNLLLLTTDTPVDFGTDTYRVYQTASSVAKDFASNSLTVAMAQSVFSQTPNILNNNGALIIAPVASTSETIAEALTRLKPLINFCGFMTTFAIETEITALTASAAQIQSENDKIYFVVSNTGEDISGAFKNMKDASNTKVRCLYYGATGSNALIEAKCYMAAYASKGLSTNFSGSNTVQTMHLKELAGVTPDPTLTETQLASCQSNGVDVYISIAGLPAEFTSGANSFFDEVLNEVWFLNALQVAGFNYLKKTNTKIPQTESGMTGLKGAYRDVCARGVTNGFLAPGSWSLPDTFGNPTTFKANIEQVGYYIYSEPIANQSPAEREVRNAPLVQIAVKTAGAIHKTNVMVYINL